MAEIKGLHAHDRPPNSIRTIYKKYQRLDTSEVDNDPDIIDLAKLDPDNPPASIKLWGSTSSKDLRLAFDEFVKETDSPGEERESAGLIEDIPVFKHELVSGLRIIPSLLPPTVQAKLLSQIFHRDLSDPRHRTNVHLHYNVTYPHEPNQRGEEAKPPYLSFFQADPARTLYPKDPDIHSPCTVQHMLGKKLRWITLGGQYDWTKKVYPDSPPPAFPLDIARLLRAAFPETDAQAAIVNLYSVNDTLSMHRDVSEQCDIGLISVSFGCDGLFMVSRDDGDGCEVIRLRTGDAVYMSGRARFAWHGVPKILPGTCPAWLQDWPGHEYPFWKGWMSGKRVNLNVRQITELDQAINMEH